MAINRHHQQLWWIEGTIFFCMCVWREKKIPCQISINCHSNCLHAESWLLRKYHQVCTALTVFTNNYTTFNVKMETDNLYDEVIHFGAIFWWLKNFFENYAVLHLFAKSAVTRHLNFFAQSKITKNIFIPKVLKDVLSLLQKLHILFTDWSQDTNI